ncbi:MULTISPECIES: MIP/aquaporin family protein [Methanobrevibacter]|jgi:glycerol uptake facilitator protein|uniref:MIP/aquaporin family protein n=1 Tax=Methanobrevibacter TaxID=2172 RepID=UPI003762A2B6|nr:aquaporin family protein [Methanobacteriaceae archaeon]
MECGIEKKMIAEALGTFFLVFFGTGAAVMTLIIAHSVSPAATIGTLGGFADWLAIGLAFGLAGMVSIYIFGKISGAHMNPAVTLGLWISKNISGKDSVLYIIAQCIGAVLASICLYIILGPQAITIGSLGATVPAAGINYFQAMFVEFIGTFFLVLTVMGVAVDKKAEPAVGGFAIGMAIATAIFLLGGITGGCINPARGFGPYLIDFLLGGVNLWNYFPIYIIGPIVGGLLAGFIYQKIAEGTDVCDLPNLYD